LLRFRAGSNKGKILVARIAVLFPPQSAFVCIKRNRFRQDTFSYPKLHSSIGGNMSLRDFNSSSEDRPIILNNEPMGNGAGLGAFHTTNPEDREPNNMPKIVGALAVALMVGTAGIYVYSVSGKSMQPKPVTVASNVQAPAPMAPAPQPAADTSATAPVPDAMTPASTPAPKAEPVKSASTKVTRTRTALADTTKPVIQPQAATIPEPVSPTPSPSDVASNVPATAPAAMAATPAPAAVTPDSQTAQNGTVAAQPQQSSTQSADATAQDQQTGAAPAQPAPTTPVQ
jgi:hypothetical protein